jgi:hypothetical protein
VSSSPLDRQCAASLTTKVGRRGRKGVEKLKNCTEKETGGNVIHFFSVISVPLW